MAKEFDFEADGASWEITSELCCGSILTLKVDLSDREVYISGSGCSHFTLKRNGVEWEQLQGADPQSGGAGN